MGKITEALDKIQKQREIQKQAWKDKQKSQSSLKERHDSLLQDAQGSVAVEEPKAPPFIEDSEKNQVNLQQKQKGNKIPIEERLKNLLGTFKELQEKFKNQVFIAKATDESGIDPRVVTYFSQNAHISEQYRILRTNIQSKSLNKQGKTFLISSAFHGEGKTVTAVNLAVALAQDLSKKVFLGDCDLRGGNIHQLLSLDLNPGLSDILANGTASEAAFQNGKISNLTILPRGKVPANPSELLGSKRMRRLLEELKTRFDYIILDAPPSIPITDAGILGAQADGVIFIVQAQKTQEDTVRRAQELLQQARAKIIGFVLTQTNYYVPHYYSYYYHYNKKAREGRG